MSNDDDVLVWLCEDGDALGDGKEPPPFAKLPFSECLDKLKPQTKHFLCEFDRPSRLGERDRLTGIRGPRHVILKIQTSVDGFKPGFYGLPLLPEEAVKLLRLSAL
jgi:hypothetical protein